jgi:hypothetical protein
MQVAGLYWSAGSQHSNCGCRRVRDGHTGSFTCRRRKRNCSTWPPLCQSGLLARSLPLAQRLRCAALNQTSLSAVWIAGVLRYAAALKLQRVTFDSLKRVCVHVW